jgi:UDP-glucose 4-epimerase
MNTDLLTGAAGFVGRSIAAELLNRGNQVRRIDNFSTGKRENLQGVESMDFNEADINDAAAISKACRASIVSSMRRLSPQFRSRP